MLSGGDRSMWTSRTSSSFCGAKDLGEALSVSRLGASMIRTKGELQRHHLKLLGHMRMMNQEIAYLQTSVKMSSFPCLALVKVPC